MDPVSQAALGAVVGQVAGHGRLGYRAAVAGALAGAFPDIDVLFSIGGDYFDQLEMHRGLTHSLFFAPVVGPLVALAIWRHEAGRPASRETSDKGRLLTWVAVVTLALLSHPLLDLTTSYGTQLFLPFSNARFAIDAMPIIDPLYTLILLAGLVLAGGWLKRRARSVAVATLVISCSYLGYAWHLNVAAEDEAARQLAANGIEDAEIAAFPTLLQVHLRRVVARTPTLDRVGYLSMWQPCEIEWQSAPRVASPAINRFLGTREGRVFSWFTMGWIRYHIEQVTDGLRLRATDLRYGFDTDPNRSIFNVSVAIGHTGGLSGAVETGGPLLDDRSGRLAGMLEDTYAPLCRLTMR